MSISSKKFTTALACRITELDRQRLADAGSLGFLRCLPETVAGRARTFTADDLVALRLYHDLVRAGHSRERSGRVACAVAALAKRFPDDPAIAYVEDWFMTGAAMRVKDVPPPETWHEAIFRDTSIKDVQTISVRQVRELIAHATARELATLGEGDDDA